jgi:hypothetical protein
MRKQKFLVDNAETMDNHWFEAQFLLETLIKKVQGIDKDGMDLMFTCSPTKVESSQKVSDFTRAMKDSKTQPRKGAKTDIQSVLCTIFDQYMEQHKPTTPRSKRFLSPFKRSEKKSTPAKNVTLIILTDGIWDGVANKEEVDVAIVKFIKQLETMKGGKLTERAFSMQFIQFGDDPAATLRLQHLDDDLKNLNIP